MRHSAFAGAALPVTAVAAALGLAGCGGSQVGDAQHADRGATFQLPTSLG